MQVLCTCAECGTSVRRDDGPLSPAPEQPKRLALFCGASAVFTLDYCNECFDDVKQGLEGRTTALRRLSLSDPRDTSEDTIE